MSNLTFESSFMSAYFDLTARVLVSIWKGFAEGTPRREALYRCLEIMVENRGSKMLVDVRNMRVVTEADEAWSRTEYMPTAAARGLRSFALILDDQPLARMGLEGITRPLQAGGVLNIRYFSDVESAHAWLAEQPD